MAGASMGDSDENPVNINITPLVDIIFCLCVFFMVSFKFKQLEGKFDAWLPKEKGFEGMPLKAVIQEIRVALFWDDKNLKVVRVDAENNLLFLRGAVPGAPHSTIALRRARRG